MTPESLKLLWKQGNLKPIYWLEGEEGFFVDDLMDFAAANILSEAEAAFDFNIYYGRDTDWLTVVNTCRRYPMQAPKQVILLKEAQMMRDIEKLDSYAENPSHTTVLIVGYKSKKLDGRTKFSKTIKQNGELLSFRKLYDNEIPGWIGSFVKSKNAEIDEKANFLLLQHIGNDLFRISSEIDKVLINKTANRRITVEDIEQYVGIHKEYNVFELQHALTSRNISGCFQIIQYFEANPKAMSLMQLLPTLYSFFSKAYLVFGFGTNSEIELAKGLGYPSLNPYVKDIIHCAKQYRQAGIEQAILLLHEYNLKGLGIRQANVGDAELMKELIVKLITPSSFQ